MSNSDVLETQVRAEGAPCVEPPSAAWCLRLLAIGQTCAVLQGFRDAEAEDCAHEFRLHYLMARREDKALVLPPSASDALLFTCATRWAQNWARRERREHQRRVGNGVEGSLPTCVVDLPDPALSPEAQVLQKELLECLCVVLLALTPADRALFVRAWLQMESPTAIAQATGRSPGAVREALSALRRRVRPLLAASGLDLAEARDYLAILLRPP
ncbi:MAG TPA: hypothetical protein VKU00_22870 [Chthonomonadaceae bacterium]|nr:hypothetical protein [Chthonomonadaceae bacterium]